MSYCMGTEHECVNHVQNATWLVPSWVGMSELQSFSQDFDCCGNADYRIDRCLK